MKARKEMVRMGTKIGAVLGGLAFLIFGTIPGFYFGSYGSLVVMKHLMGGSLEPTVLVRAVVAVGILLGIVCVASVSIVLGSIVGTGIGYAVEAATSPAAVKEGEAAAVKAK